MGTRKREMERGLQDDTVVIAVMGMTGSGKSSFIASVADEAVEVGHSLVSSTNEVKTYTFCDDHGRRGYLIDTPGFDDTHRSDAEVLIDISLCFNKLYSKGILLNGLIYLHRITDVRMQGSALKNLTLFRKICGRRAFPNVMLVTTMWDALPPGQKGIDIGNQRLDALTKEEKYFGEMDRYGSTLAKHFGSAKSANIIFNYLIDKKSKIVLEIQDQMVDRRLDLNETAAGAYLQQNLVEASRKFDVELDEVQESINVARQDRDMETVDLLRTEEVMYRTKLQTAKDDQKKLRISHQVLEKEKPDEHKKLVQIIQRERAKHAAEKRRLEQEMELAQAHIYQRDREINYLTEESDHLAYDLHGRDQELEVMRRQLKARSMDDRREVNSMEREPAKRAPPVLPYRPSMRTAPSTPQYSNNLVSDWPRVGMYRKKSI